MIIQSRLAVSKTTHRASPAKITAGDGSHPPLTKPAAEPGVVNVYVMVRILFSSTDAFGCPIRIKSACHSPKTLPARLHRRRETQGGAVEPCLRQRRSAEPDGHVAT